MQSSQRSNLTKLFEIYTIPKEAKHELKKALYKKASQTFDSDNDVLYYQETSPYSRAFSKHSGEQSRGARAAMGVSDWQQLYGSAGLVEQRMASTHSKGYTSSLGRFSRSQRTGSRQEADPPPYFLTLKGPHANSKASKPLQLVQKLDMTLVEERPILYSSS